MEQRQRRRICFVRTSADAINDHTMQRDEHVQGLSEILWAAVISIS
jgi:hypothetical protein